MDTTKTALGIFSDCIILLIKEHEPSKTVFQKIRERWTTFMEKLRKLSGQEFSVSQTGSSYDELHLSRFLANDEDGTHRYYPPIDFDFMMTYEEYKLLDRSTTEVSVQKDKTSTIQNLCHTSTCFAIMVASSGPGYVKLLVTDAGRRMLRRPSCDIGDDLTEDCFLPNWVFKKRALPEGLEEGVECLYSRGPRYVSSGPALSNVDNKAEGFTYDFVQAFPCATWPDIALNWTKRHRPFEWPPVHVIQEIIQGGCAVVPVGHHQSDKITQDLEWRVSFNAPERKLSKCLLPLQRDCYSLVKLILKIALSSHSILTSYHVKNMMFWFCEQQYGNEKDWTVETQGERILQFIDYIANALAHHSIPHYFVPPNNMVSHRTKQEIDDTHQEVIKAKEKIVTSVFLACVKLEIFEQNPSLDVLTDEKSDIEKLLTMYVSFVQTLFRLGTLNLCEGEFENLNRQEQPKITQDRICSSLSVRCFSHVVALNCCFKAYIKIASPKFLAKNVPELLKPLALAYLQAGEIKSALASYQIMLETDKERVMADFPEVFTNMACLYANRCTTVLDKKQKQQMLDIAEQNFCQALKLISDSPSSYLAFGNFLLEHKKSVSSAMEQFEKAIKIGTPRSDDDALIQLELPDRSRAISEAVHVSGKVAAYYSLCTCYVRIDDVYRARQTANKLEQEVRRSCPLKQKYPHFQICALSCQISGLRAKAEVLKSEAMKYKKCT